MLGTIARVDGSAALRAACIGVAVLLTVPVFVRSAGAQATRLKNIELCNGTDRTAFEPQIRGCTALILSDGETPRIRSVAFNNRGNAHVAEGAYDRAIEDYDQAIEIAPDYAKAYNNRAVAHGKKGRHDLALRDLDEALKRDSGYAMAFANRGEIHLIAGRFDRAEQDYGEAIRLKPTFAALHGRCQARLATGMPQSALPDCAEALQLERNAAAFDTRGVVHLRLGQWDMAISDFSAALQIEPRRATALFGRGEAYSAKGMPSQAAADHAAAKAIRPTIADEFARQGAK
jgi:tetratricopeptide (TPR) repeat protein